MKTFQIFKNDDILKSIVGGYINLSFTATDISFDPPEVYNFTGNYHNQKQAETTYSDWVSLNGSDVILITEPTYTKLSGKIP